MPTERELLIKVSQSGNAITNLLKLGTVIAGLGAATIAYGIAANESFESLRVGLESGLAAQTGFARGSNKLNAELDKMIAGLNEIGVVSPFSTEAMQEMGRTMMNMGVGYRDVIPLAQKFGDIIAASGGKTQNLMGAMRQFTQGMGKGKFSMQDFNSMVENGFPIWAMLAEHLGTTTAEVRDLQSAGGLTADMVYESIMAFDKFDGAMAAAAGTSVGLRETLADLFKLTMARLTEPIFDVWKDSLKGLVDLLGKEDVQAWIDAAAISIANFTERAIENFKGWYTLISEAIQTGDWSEVKNAVTATLKAYITDPIRNYIEGTGVYIYFSGMANLIKDAWKTGDWSLVKAVVKLTLETYIIDPIRNYIEGTGIYIYFSSMANLIKNAIQTGDWSLVRAVVKLNLETYILDPLKNFLETQLGGNEIYESLKMIAGLINAAITTGDWSSIKALILLNLETYITQPMKDYVEGTYIYGYFKGMAYLIADAFKTGDWSAVVGAVLGAIETYIVKPLQEATWDDQMLEIAGSILAALGRGFVAALAAEIGISLAVADKLTEWLSREDVKLAANEAGKNLGAGIVDGVIEFFGTEGSAKTVGAILLYIASMGLKLKSAWVDLGIEFVLGLVEGIVGSIAGDEFAGKVADAFRPALTTVLRIMSFDIYGLGKDIVEGIAEGIRGSGALKDALLAMANDAWNAIRDFFGIHSPSEMFKEIGENLMKGLAIGVKQDRAPANMFGGFMPPAMPMAGATIGGGGNTYNFEYSPVISTADKYEAEEKLFPFVQEALRKMT